MLHTESVAQLVHRNQEDIIACKHPNMTQCDEIGKGGGTLR